MADNPLKITDVTLRDGHQSLIATRLTTADMAGIAAEMDQAGFYSMEVWGGATFDVAHRFLNEDPWERPRLLKKLMPHTPLQMLLRGQNLVGYRHYADDVVAAFVHHAADVGIDIFRVFDAVNDERNFTTALRAIKECGKHAQLSLCYSITEAKLGGPVYNLDYFVSRARLLQEMGADSLCIKDMAGLMAPDDAYRLITALKAAVSIPVQLHSHFTSGMAAMTCLKAIEAGVDIIDTALAPFALRSSHPAVEPLVVALQGTPRDSGLSLPHLLKLGRYFESIAPKYRGYLDDTRLAVIDTGVLQHQIPGGMISNLVSQLREADALDRLEEVYQEVPRVRRELGYPPLVTPTSQIVGTQAVQNVLLGRYQLISAQVKDYVYGLYGKPPAPIDPEIQRTVLKGYERGETPITGRAADVLEPELERAFEATKGIARDIGDVLTYALYPTTGLRFLRGKYGLEEPSAEPEAKTPADTRQNEFIAGSRAGQANNNAVRKPGVRTFNIYLGNEVYTVGVEANGGPPLGNPVPLPTAPSAKPSRKKADPEASQEETAIAAPMPGIILSYEKKVGDPVAAGETVVVLEAMKMANSLVSPVSGKVRAINFKKGDRVARDNVLAVIGA